MKKLPIGLQDFRKLIEDGFLYVDKTEAIHRLVTTGSYYFLSRPRRFGKSLTLSTIKELFSGSRELFEGLWVEKHWDWEKTHPVVHIHFDSMGYKDKGIPNAISGFLNKEAHKHQLKLEEQFPGSQFKELIEKLHEKHGEQVVILIDEYDKPIIDYMEDLEKAKAQRDELKGFYSVIKSSDVHIRFLLITGVSKFSRVSIFSDLNNLDDITIDRRFSSMLGYTQEELEHYFQDRMAQSRQQLQLGQGELLDQIKQWYNGYSWDGENYVYNPFSILNFFSKNAFQNFWFSTGTPTFLIKLLKDRMAYNFNETEVGQVAFDSFDLDHIDTISLLFQTGYLTIKAIEPFGLYLLDYPNQEVKDSMLQYLLGAFSYESQVRSTPIVIKLRKAFLDHDLERIIAIINGQFKSIPSHIFIKEKEAYYHSIVFLVFQYLGQFIEAEVHTSDGRIDAVVQTETHIYLLEFKLDKSAAEAMQQIREKAYADKYRLQEKILTGIGINFSSETKSVEDWETEVFKQP